VKASVVYALMTMALVAVVGWGLTLGFPGAPNAAAIRWSALIVVVVQMVAFLVVKRLGLRNFMAAVGIGAILRIFTLIGYAAVIGTVLKLPPTAALISMALFFFLSSLVEPFVLRI
jgi:hypothetical protein